MLPSFWGVFYAGVMLKPMQMAQFIEVDRLTAKLGHSGCQNTQCELCASFFMLASAASDRQKKLIQRRRRRRCQKS
jgi:ferric iron reductase protein FhuF